MIYTRTGDSGTTSLVGGSRVNKDDPRVEAYGTVDELNAHIGLLSEWLHDTMPSHYKCLKTVQHNLFTLQTLLATEEGELYNRLPQLPDTEVSNLEHQIDTLQAALPPLHNFVIAGGTPAGAQCHICRTVCRRAERRVVSLARSAHVDDPILRYLNRLSDYLFLLARFAVVSEGKEESLYIN